LFELVDGKTNMLERPLNGSQRGFRVVF